MEAMSAQGGCTAPCKDLHRTFWPGAQLTDSAIASKSPWKMERMCFDRCESHFNCNYDIKTAPFRSLEWFRMQPSHCQIITFTKDSIFNVAGWFVDSSILPATQVTQVTQVTSHVSIVEYPISLSPRNSPLKHQLFPFCNGHNNWYSPLQMNPNILLSCTIYMYIL